MACFHFPVVVCERTGRYCNIYWTFGLSRRDGDQSLGVTTFACDEKLRVKKYHKSWCIPPTTAHIVDFAIFTSSRSGLENQSLRCVTRHSLYGISGGEARSDMVDVMTLTVFDAA